MNAIDVDGLAKRFGDRVAVDGITFAVEQGQIFGFLGPNGAGKTTTIRMLTCQLRPSAGSARLLGCDLARDAMSVKSLIGVVFEEQNLYERLSGRENLAFAARLHNTDHQRIAAVLDLVGLTSRAHDRVAHYSNGMRQRLLLARALLHRPRLLFLDEPTRGLDPASAREIRALIAGLASLGVTVFLTTHAIEEADHLCQRVAIIDHGRIVALDTPRALRLAHGRREARVLCRDGREETLSLVRPGEAAQLAALIAAGDVVSIHSQEATLEDAFIALTGRSLVE